MPIETWIWFDLSQYYIYSSIQATIKKRYIEDVNYYHLHQQMSGHDIHRLQIVSKGSLLYNNHTGVRSAKITCLNPVMIFKFISLKLLKDRTEDNFSAPRRLFIKLWENRIAFEKKLGTKHILKGHYQRGIRACMLSQTLFGCECGNTHTFWTVIYLKYVATEKADDFLNFMGAFLPRLSKLIPKSLKP